MHRNPLAAPCSRGEDQGWLAGLGGSHFAGFGFPGPHLFNYFDLELGKPLFFGASFVPKMLNFNLVLAGWGRQGASPKFPGVYSQAAVEIKPGAPYVVLRGNLR